MGAFFIVCCIVCFYLESSLAVERKKWYEQHRYWQCSFGKKKSSLTFIHERNNLLYLQTAYTFSHVWSFFSAFLERKRQDKGYMLEQIQWKKRHIQSQLFSLSLIPNLSLSLSLYIYIYIYIDRSYLYLSYSINITILFLLL